MQSAENYLFKVDEILHLFKSALVRQKGSTKISYKKAVTSFECFILSSRLQSTLFDTALLEQWYFTTRRNGATFNTALFYFNILSGLYKSVSEKKSKAVDIFKPLRDRINRLDSDKEILIDNSKKIDALISRNIDKEPDPEKALYKDISLFSLLSGDFDFSALSSLKKENVDLLAPALKEIALRHISPTRKYVFPLDQTKFTKKQLKENLDQKLTTFLKSYGFSVKISAEDTLRGIWANLALNSGISPDAVIAFLGKAPSSCPLLALCSPGEIKPGQKEELLEGVRSQFKTETPSWYAMQLRQGVKYDDLRKRLAQVAADSGTSVLKTFYPVEEISRKIGKRLTKEEKPVIGNIVFFRSLPCEVYPLFRNIWEIAWCYRDKSTPGNPYAVIRDAEMDIFRKAIGMFTPEFEVAPTGELPLKPGDKVVIIDGQFTDMMARVIKPEPKPSEAGTTVYRVMLSDIAGKWSLSLDARLLRPVS